MERTGRLPIAVVAIACLVGAAGCTMCPDPYDSSGPVPNGSVAQNDFRARSNGIIPLGSAPLPWPAVVDATPLKATDVPTIAAAEPTGESASPDDMLEIPATESVLSDDAEVASEPESVDDDSVRMLSAAEEAGIDDSTEIASPTPTTAEPEPASEFTTTTVDPETDGVGDESDVPVEPAAPRPMARPAPRTVPAATARPRVAPRSPATPAAPSIGRSAVVPQPRPEPAPAMIDLQPVGTAEPPDPLAPSVEPGLSETPGWRPRGYVRPAREGR